MEKLPTLDEAINNNYKKFKSLNLHYRICGGEHNRRCALEYYQLYKWLKQLKEYKEKEMKDDE